MRGGVEERRGIENKYLDSFRVAHQRLQYPALAVSENSFTPLKISRYAMSMRENRTNTGTAEGQPCCCHCYTAFPPSSIFTAGRMRMQEYAIGSVQESPKLVQSLPVRGQQ